MEFSPIAVGKLKIQNQSFQWRLSVSGREIRCRGQHLPLAYGSTGFVRAAQYLFTPVFEADFRKIVAANQHAVFSRTEDRRLEQTLIIAQQVDGAEGAFCPGGRIQQHQVVLPLLQSRVSR